MPRATSLLLRITMLALAVNAGCAFPFFRSKETSLEEVVTVEAMSEQDAQAALAAAAEKPQTADAPKDKPMPPIARFFSGLFGRGKPAPPTEPISTIPTPAGVAHTTQPKIEFNNTEAVGAGVVASSVPQSSPAAGEAGASKISTQPTPTAAATSQPTEIINPTVAAAAPQANPAPAISDGSANPTKTTYGSQSPRSQGGSLTAALRSALDEASKDGLAQDSPAHSAPTYAAASQPNLATPSVPTATSPPAATKMVDLSSSPLGTSRPAAQPQAPAPQVIENPTAGSSQIVNAASPGFGNPLRSTAPSSNTRMVEIAADPIGSRPEKPQVVYPPKAEEPVAESTTLVAFQSHVHGGDSIVNQLKQSRRVNEFRDKFDSVEDGEAPKTPAAQSAAAAVQAAPAQSIPAPSRATVVAAVPTPLPPEVETPVQQPTAPQPAVIQPMTPQPRSSVVAAPPILTPKPAAVPTPVQVAAPPTTPPQPKAFAATVPLANPATAPLVPPQPQPEPAPARPETLAQLVPSSPDNEAALEQPGREPVELPAASLLKDPEPHLASTPTNPVRAVPRVAVPTQAGAGSPPAPHLASRPSSVDIEPLLLPSQSTSQSAVSPVDTPKLAPVVTVEEYRRMQQMRRSQSTLRY